MKKLSIILAILLVSQSCFGELTSYTKYKWLGVNSRVNPKLISDDEAVDASNITLDTSGAFKDRDTFGQYNSLPGALGNNPITGLFKYYTITSKFFVACAGSKIASGAGGVWTDITQAGLAITSGSYWSAVTFNNELYLFNSSCAMQNWNGAGLTTTPAGVPTTNCAYGAVHKARVWAAKSDTIPYRLYFSSLNNAEDWVTTGGYVDLPDMTQTITGLVSWGGYLFVFTETNIFRILGSTPNDFSMQKTNSQVGAIAPRSVKVSDIGIIFLARSGVFAFDGNSSNKLSDKIEPSINNISPTQIQNSAGVYDGQNKYWLSYTYKTSSYNDKILIYDTILKEWYPFDNLNISYFERAYGGTDKGELYGGSSLNNGIVYSLQSSSGTESVSHSTETDFNNQVTFNTVTTAFPSVILKNGNDKYCVLLAHFNGVDGQTTYTTEDSGKRAVTFVANAKLSTTQKKFGVSSLGNLDGGSDYVTVPDSPDWTFGTGDFTIDFWVNLTNANAYNPFVVQFAAATDFWETWLNGSQLFFSCRLGSVYVAQVNTTASAGIPTGVWTHIAYVMNGSTLYMYVNGISQATTIVTAPGNLTDVAAPLAIGNYSTLCMGGYIDEVRVSKGIGGARWTSNFTPSKLHEYGDVLNDGTLTSQNIQINASGITTLDKITWTGGYPSNTKIAFQTRTGVTNDTVYFNNWQAWTSDNTVTINTITDATIEWFTNDSTNFKVSKPTYPQLRNIVYYEDEDNVSPNLVSFNTVGAVSKGKFAWTSIALKDLSSYDWLGVWFKSPQTGNTVEFSIGENLATENTVTFNTVQANTWQKGYWYIGGISSTSRDEITKLSVRYMGDTIGSVILGETSAYNFYDSGDTMTSTPNDYIQYRGILGTTNDTLSTPELYSTTLVYTPSSGTPESSLDTYYETKYIDFGSPQINKQFLDFYVDVYTNPDSELKDFYFDYDIDNGKNTGTIAIPSSSTVTDNTVKIKDYFPSNTFGKTMKFSYRNDEAITSKHTIEGIEVRFRPEPL